MHNILAQVYSTNMFLLNPHAITVYSPKTLNTFTLLIVFEIYSGSKRSEREHFPVVVSAFWTPLYILDVSYIVMM